MHAYFKPIEKFDRNCELTGTKSSLIQMAENAAELDVPTYRTASGLEDLDAETFLF